MPDVAAPPSPAARTSFLATLTGGRLTDGQLVRVLGAVIVAGVAAAAGYLSSSRQTPVYESRVVMMIDQPTALFTAKDDGVVAKLSKLRAKYTGLVRTDVITVPVATELHLSKGFVAASVFATADPSSLLLVVGARSTKADRTAATLATSTATALTAYIDGEQSQLAIAPAAKILLTTVVPAGTPLRVTAPRTRALTVGAIAGLVGLGVGFVGATLVEARPPGSEP